MRVVPLAAALFCSAAMAQTADRPCSGNFRSPAPWLENFHHAEIPQAPAMPTLVTLASRAEDLLLETTRVARDARWSYDYYAFTDLAREARANLALLAALGQSPTAPLILFALKDGTIRAATSYAMEGNTLRYVTPDGKTMEVPLDAIDRPLTERLNRERNVEVRLP